MNNRSVVAIVCAIIMLLGTIAEAGILADVYAKKVAGARYQTEVFGLDIIVEPKAVTVNKCVDGIRIIMISGDKSVKSMKMPNLEAMATKEYGKVMTVTSVSPGNCPDRPDENVIRFTHDGKSGDITFFNAVERTLNRWLPGSKVVVK